MKKLWMQEDYDKAVESCKNMSELSEILAEIGSVVVEHFKRVGDLYEVFEGQKTNTYIAIGGILFTKDGIPTCYRQEYPQCFLHEKAFHILEMEFGNTMAQQFS